MTVADKKSGKKSSIRYWRTRKNWQKATDNPHNHKDYCKSNKYYVYSKSHLYSEIIWSTDDLFICNVME